MITISYPKYCDICNYISSIDGVSVENLTTVVDALDGIRFSGRASHHNIKKEELPEWLKQNIPQHIDLLNDIIEKSEHKIFPNKTDILKHLPFAKKHRLIKCADDMSFSKTERGHLFCDHVPDILREIDFSEGIFEILTLFPIDILDGQGLIKPKYITDEKFNFDGAQYAKLFRTKQWIRKKWKKFFLKVTDSPSSESTTKSLNSRLKNLSDRKIVFEFDGDVGFNGNWASYVKKGISMNEEPKNYTQIEKSIQKYNDLQKQILKEKLSLTDPYQFEHIICDLLKGLGYQDVSVTKLSGDKGVDIVAKTKMGITTITEVVQVKRQKSNVHRPVLDALRGSLHYFEANKGTIITLSQFSEGCKDVATYPGAPQITLIDGDMLIELLVENEICIKAESQDIYEIDEEYILKGIVLNLG